MLLIVKKSEIIWLNNKLPNQGSAGLKKKAKRDDGTLTIPPRKSNKTLPVVSRSTLTTHFFYSVEVILNGAAERKSVLLVDLVIQTIPILVDIRQNEKFHEIINTRILHPRKTSKPSFPA